MQVSLVFLICFRYYDNDKPEGGISDAQDVP